MSKFFYAENLTRKDLKSDLLPWDFVLTETLTAQIRGDKEARQEWYHNATTKHYFYTLVEPANPNMRPSKDDNPARLLHGFVADLDCKIPDQRIDESLTEMKLKPSWVERSLGGNVRLVYLLEKPLIVDSHKFCSFLLKRAVKWLELAILPGLDEPAFTDPTRLMCNGCKWRPTGAGPLPAEEVQAFFVACGKDFRFKPIGSVADIPIDVVEKAVREKFPGFDWPGAFTIGSQGPSFWVPGSVSPQSAIIHAGGMFTFSAHAEKPFYGWGDILGKEFIDKYLTQSVAAATDDIWYDGHNYYKKNERGHYVMNKEKDILNYFEVTCRVSSKPGKDGSSPMKKVLNHLAHGPGRVDGVAPFAFMPPGIITYQDKRFLNTYCCKPVVPAKEKTVWGPEGGFPFISSHIDFMFSKCPYAKAHYLAWLKVLYTSALNLTPHPGQNCYFLGPPNVGKTAHSHLVVGGLVGGFCDASKYLAENGTFNSELLEVGLWCSDDETTADSPTAQATFAATTKRAAANQDLLYSKKYEAPCMVRWAGRVFATMNLDFISSRTLGQLDNSSLDKTHLFLIDPGTAFAFPHRDTHTVLVTRELPYFGRFLLDYEPPDYVIRDTRYGFLAYHEEALLDRASQSGRYAPFKELVITALKNYFTNNPEANFWQGSQIQLSQLINAHASAEVVRTLKLESTSRYLEMIQHEGLLKCSVSTGQFKVRIWTFERFGDEIKPTEPPSEPPTTNTENPFQK